MRSIFENGGEMVAMGQALEELERPKAKERTKQAGAVGGKHKGSVNFTDPSVGSTRDKVGAAIGMSGVQTIACRARREAREGAGLQEQKVADPKQEKTMQRLHGYQPS